jgi:hypothetical protein
MRDTHCDDCKSEQRCRGPLCMRRTSRIVISRLPVEVESSPTGAGNAERVRCSELTWRWSLGRDAKWWGNRRGGLVSEGLLRQSFITWYTSQATPYGGQWLVSTTTVGIRQLRFQGRITAQVPTSNVDRAPQAHKSATQDTLDLHGIICIKERINLWNIRGLEKHTALILQLCVLPAITARRLTPR